MNPVVIKRLLSWNWDRVVTTGPHPWHYVYIDPYESNSPQWDTRIFDYITGIGPVHHREQCCDEYYDHHYVAVLTQNFLQVSVQDLGYNSTDWGADTGDITYDAASLWDAVYRANIVDSWLESLPGIGSQHV